MIRLKRLCLWIHGRESSYDIMTISKGCESLHTLLLETRESAKEKKKERERERERKKEREK